MAAYVIARLAARDTAWRESYSPKTAELIRKHGGKVLAPFGSKVEALEGNAKLPTNVVILEFPSKSKHRCQTFIYLFNRANVIATKTCA